MRVLVTGSSGYIGRRVVSRLAAEGFTTLGADIRTGSDLTRPIGLHDRMNLVGVIHLAAHCDVAESVSNPTKYDENVLMSRTVADLGLPTVLASSAAVYGEPIDGTDLTEGAAISPINPYGVSKVLSEAVLPDAMRLRFFNVAGGGDRGRHLIPNLVRAAAEQRPFALTGDVRTIRDYVHVEDVAAACVLALRALLEGAKGAALNVCTGQDYTIGDIVTLVAAITGEPIRVTAAPTRQGDPAWLVGDNTAARETIGWAPALTIEDIIASAWNERVPA